MKPVSISISAFGPYADVQALDFGELGDKRFFLIHGPTGAGKTTILDAMTYALYGDTSGDERSATDMRSHLASPDRETEVTFDFTVGERAYRVWRRPKQPRPKQRGGGFTESPADAGLWDRTGLTDQSVEGQVLASGLRAVNAQVEELLGFSADQFRQVVVLPQGRFREVLSADVKKREEILRQLFRTERFADMTDFLKHKRNELEREIKGSLERRAGVLKGAGVETREELDALAQAAAEREATASIARAHADAAMSQANTALQAGRSAASAIGERDAAEAALAAIEATRADVDVKRTELDAARKVAGLEAKWGLREERRAAEARATDSLKSAQERLPAADSAFANACVLSDKAEAADRDTRQLERLDAQAAAAARKAEDVERLVAATTEASAARTAVGVAERAIGTAREAAELAEAHVAELDAAWRASRASVLAAELEPGTPCPVCGSTEHPHPAGESAGADEAELDKARVAARSAGDRLATALARVEAACDKATEAEAREKAERERLGELADADASTVKAQALESAAECARLREKLAKADADLEACRAARSAAQDELTRVQAAIETCTSALATAVEGRVSAEADFEAALAASDVTDEQSFMAARRTTVEVDALEGAVARFDAEFGAATERLARAKAAVKAIAQAPDIAALETAAAQAQAALGEADRALATASSESKQYTHAIQTIEEIEALGAELHGRHALVGRLADTACGDNALKLSLQRYVLGSYLDEVLLHASYHLQRMTAGRYRLQRSSGAGDLRRPAGLELEVYDELTTSSRPASTLSGGEGFMASLSLALGLAEAVQAHAGGVKLDTIFIDEGFGSLDEESLDMAVRMLLNLASVAAGQGRLVGIISHVSELREQIDARLEIAKSERGSTARFVV